jgi:Raf kinase inhibitor-like YbhB/YbcL family protein
MSTTLTTEAFQPNGAIPARYTCDGEDISPQLSWSGAPQNTAAFALIVDDPDALGGVFTHWVLVDLPARAQGLPASVPRTDRLAEGGTQGRNSFGRLGYSGPCPPPGSPHHYRFTLYALDRSLGLGPGSEKQQVLSAMQGHTLGQAQLVGTYQRRGTR